eukprot:SAG11_NODE_12436_length_703_cov_1.789735_2_plen_74_part_00
MFGFATELTLREVSAETILRRLPIQATDENFERTRGHLDADKPLGQPALCRGDLPLVYAMTRAATISRPAICR